MKETSSTFNSPKNNAPRISWLETWFPRETRLTMLYFLGIIVLCCLCWEGIKWVGQRSNYELDLGIKTLDLSPTKDLTMPHLADIISALSKPAQRNGPPLLEQLFHASLFTLREALLGFAMGTSLGLLLAIIFVHSPLLRSGLMPYVVASQTVPILALAPIIVIWTARLDIRQLGVPIIAAYLAFFPIVIYSLRGLSDVPETALELMRSYAANWWEILWKLRFPNALPYIFTALKITAPASIVGAIIGELPSGIQKGLGGQIINFNQYYITGPNRLWATNLITAIVGISFFIVVALVERFAIGWKYANTPFNRLVLGIVRAIMRLLRPVLGLVRAIIRLLRRVLAKIRAITYLVLSKVSPKNK